MLAIERCVLVNVHIGWWNLFIQKIHRVFSYLLSSMRCVHSHLLNWLPTRWRCKVINLTHKHINWIHAPRSFQKLKWTIRIAVIKVDPLYTYTCVRGFSSFHCIFAHINLGIKTLSTKSERVRQFIISFAHLHAYTYIKIIFLKETVHSGHWSS